MNRLWAVLRAVPWNAVRTTEGCPVTLTDEPRMSHFIPVFASQAEAAAWAGGRSSVIAVYTDEGREEPSA